jgi:hypothetical protein
MSEENSTGNNLIWAITMLIVVAIIAGALFFAFSKSGPKTPDKIDVDVKVPAR